MAYYAMASLGAGKTGLTGTLGYRLINQDNTVNVPFTTTNVAETSVPGDYVVTGGIILPSTFQGRIEWGTAGTKMAEEPIQIVQSAASAGVPWQYHSSSTLLPS